MMNFQIDSKSIEDGVIQIQSRSLLDPLLSDIDFKNSMARVLTTLKLGEIQYFLDFMSLPTPTGQGPCGSDKVGPLVVKYKIKQKSGDSCGEIRQKNVFYLELFIDLVTSHRNSPFYLITRDRPFSKPYGPWPA